jgi:hypothetical protein
VNLTLLIQIEVHPIAAMYAHRIPPNQNKNAERVVSPGIVSKVLLTYFAHFADSALIRRRASWMFSSEFA